MRSPAFRSAGGSPAFLRAAPHTSGSRVGICDLSFFQNFCN
jgi:hypothetical protein